MRNIFKKCIQFQKSNENNACINYEGVKLIYTVSTELYEQSLAFVFLKKKRKHFYEY